MTVKPIFFPNVPLLKLRRVDFARVKKRSCGVPKPKDRNSKISMRAAFPENPPKTMIYDALATWNQDFEQVLEDLQRLEALGIFPRRWQRQFLKLWRATLEETRAWANFEVIDVMHQAEEREMDEPRPPPSTVGETICAFRRRVSSHETERAKVPAPVTRIEDEIRRRTRVRRRDRTERAAAQAFREAARVKLIRLRSG